MLTLSAVGVYGLAAELYVLVWSLPLVAIFSPRIMGNVSILSHGMMESH
jgi:hypothetical protein